MRAFSPLALAFAAAVLAVACGSSTNNGFDNGHGDGGLAGDDGGNPFGQGDSGDDGAHPCVNLECQKVTCGGGASTTISGIVYDPGGVRPLYNVYVYVPNAALAPIDSGPKCTQCQAPASGSPIASATTDATGYFQIKDVPVGTDIPLVLQLGKWRRHLTLPAVQQCTDNVYNTKKAVKDSTIESFMRLPKKQKETSADDNIPLIALTTGCDYGECFLRNTIGIDNSEFTGGPNGTGRVQIYRGHDDGQQLPGSPGDAYSQLWQNGGNLGKYDIVFNSCECNTYDRGTGYANMQAYLNSGGRFFGTHYHYNFFANQSQCAASYFPDSTCKGPSDFNSVADWRGDGGGKYSSAPYYIDTTFPKGKSMADWIQNVQGGTYGQLALYDIRQDVDKVTTGKATRWIYDGSSSDYSTLYLSFNTPVSAPVQNQCGRAVFSDVHLSGSSFSGFCNAQNTNDPHHVDETALEFLFFDLSSCVQDDSKPPPPPPPN